jgi:hypothetical protein
VQIAKINLENVDSAATSARIKVAVIEDDASMRQALSFQLNTAGLEVVAYACAEELLEASDAREFDCVVAQSWRVTAEEFGHHRIQSRAPHLPSLFRLPNGNDQAHRGASIECPLPGRWPFLNQCPSFTRSEAVGLQPYAPNQLLNRRASDSSRLRDAP